MRALARPLGLAGNLSRPVAVSTVVVMKGIIQLLHGFLAFLPPELIAKMGRTEGAKTAIEQMPPCFVVRRDVPQTPVCEKQRGVRDMFLFLYPAGPIRSARNVPRTTLSFGRSKDSFTVFPPLDFIRAQQSKTPCL